MSLEIKALQKKIQLNDFELSKHVVDRSIIRKITIIGIKDVIAAGQDLMSSNSVQYTLNTHELGQ